MGTFFELGKDKAAKERDVLCLSSAVPKIRWDSNSHYFYGYSVMGNLCLLYTSGQGNTPTPLFPLQKLLTYLAKKDSVSAYSTLKIMFY